MNPQIVAELYRLTSKNRLTQAKAGQQMGVSPPKVSRQFKGNFREYSAGRQMNFLTACDQDVEIIAKPRQKDGPRGSIRFRHAAA
jgi:predicted XRE-type DNA-binding protein